MEGILNRVSTFQPLNQTLERVGANTTMPASDAAIQRGKLFHVIVTYGGVPKQVGRNEAGIQWDEGESVVARQGATQWSGHRGKGYGRVRNARKSNVQRISYRTLSTNTTLPKTTSNKTNINQPSWCWFVEKEGTHRHIDEVSKVRGMKGLKAICIRRLLSVC